MEVALTTSELMESAGAPMRLGLGWVVFLCFIGPRHYEDDVVFVLQFIQHCGFGRNRIFGGFQT